MGDYGAVCGDAAADALIDNQKDRCMRCAAVFLHLGFYADCAVSPINTRALHERVTNSIARKGQGTKSLVGSRGNAHWVPPINTRAQPESVTNSIARKGQGRNSLAGCRDSVPAGVKGQRPLGLPSFPLYTIVTIATAMQGKCEFAVTSGAKRLRAGKKRAIIENEKAR